MCNFIQHNVIIFCLRHVFSFQCFSNSFSHHLLSFPSKPTSTPSCGPSSVTPPLTSTAPSMCLTPASGTSSQRTLSRPSRRATLCTLSWTSPTRTPSQLWPVASCSRRARTYRTFYPGTSTGVSRGTWSTSSSWCPRGWRRTSGERACTRTTCSTPLRATGSGSGPCGWCWWSTRWQRRTSRHGACPCWTSTWPRKRREWGRRRVPWRKWRSSATRSTDSTSPRWVFMKTKTAERCPARCLPDRNLLWIWTCVCGCWFRCIFLVFPVILVSSKVLKPHIKKKKKRKIYVPYMCQFNLQLVLTLRLSTLWKTRPKTYMVHSSQVGLGKISWNTARFE